MRMGGQRHASDPLPWGMTVLLVQEAGWVPGCAEYLVPTGIRTPNWPVVGCYTD